MPRKAKSKTPPLPKFRVILGTCLGHKTYRGFGSLKDLTAISEADIFDQETNPLGTQRNLSLQRARKAYQYVTEKDKAFYPEIILNVRDSSYVRFKGAKSVGAACGILEFVKDPRKSEAIVVSRLDGNHRLWFADGHEGSFEAVDRQASVCFLLLPKIEQELELFRDINDNQMGMNTSHLQNITAPLFGEKGLHI